MLYYNLNLLIILIKANVYEIMSGRNQSVIYLERFLSETKDNEI